MPPAIRPAATVWAIILPDGRVSLAITHLRDSIKPANWPANLLISCKLRSSP